MPQRVNWSLTVSIITLLVILLGAVLGHAVMTERRLATLESKIQDCLSK